MEAQVAPSCNSPRAALPRREADTLFQSKFGFPNVLPQDVAWSGLGRSENVDTGKLCCGSCLQKPQIRMLSERSSFLTSVSAPVQNSFNPHMCPELLQPPHPKLSSLLTLFISPPLLRRSWSETVRAPSSLPSLSPAGFSGGSLSPPHVSEVRGRVIIERSLVLNKCTERRNRKTC